MSEFRVATAGDDGTIDAALESADATTAPPTDADALVTFGERALVDAALDDPGLPILPVDAGPGRHSVPKQRLGHAFDALAAGECRTKSHVTLSASVGGERVARAFLDASLMTGEPARISEYSVHGDGEEVDRFRADGVVVATPAGSAGYARDAGGSVLAPGAGLSVVPVSPFETIANTWVLGDELTVVVERDDGDVVLVADDRVVGPVPAGEPVDVAPDGTVEVLHVPGVAASPR